MVNQSAFRTEGQFRASKTATGPATIVPKLPCTADQRLKRPNALVRVLGWLLRPVVWEAMRQHPRIDCNRSIDDPALTLWDALRGQNRHLGYGP